MYIQNVVVGAGFAGAVIARRIAEEKNQKVLIIEKHSHIAAAIIGKEMKAEIAV